MTAVGWLATCAALSCALLFGGVPGRAASTTCDSIAPPINHAPDPEPRESSIDDLLRLRDISTAQPVGKMFAVSPDRKWIAFQLRQANPSANSYCLAVMIVSLDGKPPVMIDRGGELIRSPIVGVAALTVDSGYPDTITPVWAPDGTSLMFLKRIDGRNRIWSASIDGARNGSLTSADIDVVRFRLSADGRSLIFVTRPSISRMREEIDQEGLSGFHFDDRFIPIADSRPQLPPIIPERIDALDLASRAVRPATEAERRYLGEPRDDVPKAKGSMPTAPNTGIATWIEITGSAASPEGLVKYRSANGAISQCRSIDCDLPRAPSWVTPDGRRVLFLRREGWANSVTGLYEWDPRSGATRRIVRTDDYLVQCEPAGGTLLCFRETSTRPRHLVRIDLRSGRMQDVFDPNPEWRSLRFGKVERIKVRNEFGLESTADVAYPADYDPHRRYPAVVVQYVSRGFLRGGVGDEYPIFPLTAKGYIVLSVNRPPHLGLLAGKSTLIEAERVALVNWSNRKSILSSIEIPLRQLIADGAVDKDRIGITGLSDGSTTVQFALQNSRMFAAAVMSDCCWERAQGSLLGPQIDHIFGEMGYPNLLIPAQDFWKRISIAMNAGTTNTPILIQAADSEYLGSLESYTALRQARRPIDLFVFPGEFHNKWQPAHRKAIYRRVIDWFDFWLKDETPTDGQSGIDAKRWAALGTVRRQAK